MVNDGDDALNDLTRRSGRFCRRGDGTFGGMENRRWLRHRPTPPSRGEPPRELRRHENSPPDQNLGDAISPASPSSMAGLLDLPQRSEVILHWYVRQTVFHTTAKATPACLSKRAYCVMATQPGLHVPHPPRPAPSVLEPVINNLFQHGVQATATTIRTRRERRRPRVSTDLRPAGSAQHYAGRTSTVQF